MGNKKKLKEAKKEIDRIMFVTDDRDSAFRQCRPIDPFSNQDWEIKSIPQKWLIPISWKQIIEEIDDLELQNNNFMKSRKMILSNYFIDMKLLNEVKALHSNEDMINEIKDGEKNILIKYLSSNHASDISANDIDQIKKIGVEFKFGYGYSRDALRMYCGDTKNEGKINKPIVEALIRGGCPINWDYEENENDEKGEEIKTHFTPLHLYCRLIDSNLDGFAKLIECGADPKIESSVNLYAIYYLLSDSKNVSAEWIAYLKNECQINFNSQSSNNINLFNAYLRNNENITLDAVRALVEVADCDANSRDDAMDCNSIKAYIKNENTADFNFEIIKLLVELGADINEADTHGVYSIQHLLRLSYTPLSKMKEYVLQMTEIGAKIEHILCDDATVIQEFKVYILQGMKFGYEYANGALCVNISYMQNKKKCFRPVLLDEKGFNEILGIPVKRSNLISVDEQMLFDELKQPKNEISTQNMQQLEMEKYQNDYKEEEEEESEVVKACDDEKKEELELEKTNKEKESEDVVRDKNDDIILEMSKFVK